MKKILILTIIIMSFLQAKEPSYLKNLHTKKLNVEQVKILQKCYNYGRAFRLSYTLTAICWLESRGGIFIYNDRTHDFGITGININDFLKRTNRKNTKYNRMYYSSKLMRNDMLAMQYSVHNILYWKKTRRLYRGKPNWILIWSSYNRGYKSNNMRYGYRIAKVIKRLKRFYWLKRSYDFNIKMRSK